MKKNERSDGELGNDNMHTVIAEELCRDPQKLEDQFYKTFERLGLRKDFNEAKAIFIKPNLTYPIYKRGVTTQKDFVESLVGALRQINTETKIYIGEGEGGYNSFSMTDAMHGMGFYDIPKRYSNVEIVNLSRVKRRRILLKAKGKPYELDLPDLFFDEIDFSITCPLPKVHCMTRITLSFKNQWGCLPDVMRLKNHYVFDEIIGQVCDALKFKYAFLDGKYGLNNNGPMDGTPIEVNWFVASNSLGAFDRIVSNLMEVPWTKVKHLRVADKYGYIPKTGHINLEGNLSSLKTKFVLKRDLWNYPALIAFGSYGLTHLFYFSRVSKLLHDIMYTFRKRPID